MPTTLFSIVGLVFSALSLFSLSFLASVAADIDSRREAYGDLAREITHALASDWKLASVAPYCSQEALEELSPQVAGDGSVARSLGPLVRIETVRVEPLWKLPVGNPSIGKLADRLAALINRSVSVRFVARFASGDANVTAGLKAEGGRMKLWRLRIEYPNAAPPRQDRPVRRAISYA
ncbi:hypothetical protein [Hyphomicrobium sp. NDB2Meth4]|uniref:hypothetical protein n=1 Tax=Hyphomicrobium sp. NDB2Meth4 TaxID=1892846 RepID=UPI0009307E81|nr:hypothetical protein [Hyphomicrobium sp. NDB2Meth4]